MLNSSIEMRPVDRELTAPIDIGVPFEAARVTPAQLEANTKAKLSDTQLEQDVRLGKC